MRVFISYRRSDSEGFSKQLDKKLAAKFGRERVFIDVHVIPHGRDFRPAIDQAVRDCDALIAVIGSAWLETRQNGGRRLDDPADYVRYEIAAGLARNVPVIPVLLDGVDMPSADELPANLTALTYRQAFPLQSGKGFRTGVEQLIKCLDNLPITKSSTEAPVSIVDSPRSRPPDAGPNMGDAPETIICGSGEFHELRRLDHDGKIETMKKPLYYGNGNATVRISGSTVSVHVENLKIYTHPSLTEDYVQSDGRFAGAGPLDNGYAYLTYKGENFSTQKTWTGVCTLRIPKTGNIHGFWMTEGHKEVGKVVMGELSIIRTIAKPP